MGFFCLNPKPFYKMASDFLDMTKYQPTFTHHFCRKLYQQGIVKRYMTQNIDSLELKAGFKLEEITQAHGGNNGAECAICFKDCDVEKLKEGIKKAEPYFCERTKENGDACGGPVKPKITFFGQDLPIGFLSIFDEMQQAPMFDLLIVIGTSLAVAPFN